MTHLSVMAGQAVIVPVPSNQAHQWTSHKDVVMWRYTVGRPAASTVSGVEAPR